MAQRQRREELHEILAGFLPVGKKAYFQPPENVKMEFPCIVYERDFASTQFANNFPYRHHLRYQVTVISRDPDNEIRDKVEQLPMCLFKRHFTADDLHHDVFDLYF